MGMDRVEFPEAFSILSSKGSEHCVNDPAKLISIFVLVLLEAFWMGAILKRGLGLHMGTLRN